jgi:hypothetical protein
MHWLSPIPLRLLVVGAATCAQVASSQEKAGGEKALEQFFELGLPDAKSGKWVRAYLRESAQEPAMPGGYNARYSGNAWLLRDEKGIVEVVTGDGRFVRGKKPKGDNAGTGDEGPMPMLQIQPADLEKDIKVFTAALKNPLGGRYTRDIEDTARQTAHMAGGSLLFLAQLQRQGRGDFVREALPQVLAMAASPEKALDGAVTLLADAQLANLTRDWNRNGNTAAYAAGIEALAAKFPRGWEHREVAGLLAVRLREQKPAALAAEPDAKHAAEFLLKLEPAQFGELPLGQNWFISSGGGGRMSGFPMPPGIQDIGAMIEDEDGGPEKPMKHDSAVGVFFTKKREAALALAKLLDDRRFVRFDHRGGRDYTYYSFGERKSREAIIREQYSMLPRPYEIGELAWDILSALLPDDTRNQGQQKPATRAALALAWLKSAVSKSDEELAWTYLRGANGTYDNVFRNGLRFLVEQGGPETLANLREVFFDPGVWNDSSLGEMIPHVERYMKRAPADPAFADKLRAAVKAGLDAADAENRTQYSGSGMEEMKKQMAAQRAAQMKQLDRLFKPPQPLAEQLAEIVAMEETEALAALMAVGEILAKKPLAEIEPPLLQAAAKAKSVPIKPQMLQILMGTAMNGTPARTAAKGDATPPLPADAPTRDAMLTLLRDETPVENEWNPSAKFTIADSTAMTLLWLHSDPAAQAQWQSLGTSVPHLTSKWMRAHAIALASGKPPPPFPNAANVPAEKAAALVRELGALAAKDVPAALEKRSPDEQLAIVARLAETPEWPASLAEAQFTVRDVSGKSAGELGAGGWKGRHLDEKLIHEIEAAIVRTAAGGKFHRVSVNLAGPLAGVAISVEGSEGKMTMQQLTGIPGMNGTPAPIAWVFISIQGSQTTEDRGGWTGFGFPIWKDEAATRAWREAHGKPKGDSKQSDEPPAQEIPVNPAPFEARLRGLFAFKKDARGSLQLMIYASAIGKDDE